MTDSRAGRRGNSAASAVQAAGSLQQVLGERRALLLLLDRVSVLRWVSERARCEAGLDAAWVGDLTGVDAITLRGHVGIEHEGLRELFVPRGLGLGGRCRR